VDIEVPATAEIVIEGKVLPNVREMEGPFGEFTGFYGKEENNPVVEVTAITHRKDPIYLAGLTGLPTTDNHILKEFAYSATMYEKLKNDYPEVQNVHYSPAGGSQFFIIISMKQRYKGEARNVLLSALGDLSRPKFVVVVDDDIDIFDHVKVLWAMNFCMQPAEDVIIIPCLAGGPLDPSVPEKDITSVIGIDATRPFGVEFPEVVKIPGTDEVQIPKPRK
jgi:2,5-furandicarboxylate decarboxylase 1